MGLINPRSKVQVLPPTQKTKFFVCEQGACAPCVKDLQAGPLSLCDRGGRAGQILAAKIMPAKSSGGLVFS